MNKKRKNCILFARFWIQNLKQDAVDSLRGIFGIGTKCVTVYAKGVHVFAMANKLFELTFWKTFHHGNEGVPQLIGSARIDAIGAAIECPAMPVGAF